MRKRSFGRFSMAVTTRLPVIVHESQRDIDSRKNARDKMNTRRAPARDAR